MGDDGDGTFAEAFFELALNLGDGLGFEVGHFGATAEFLEALDADLGGDFLFASRIDFIDELLIGDSPGEDVFEECEELTFGICFLFLCHSD